MKKYPLIVLLAIMPIIAVSEDSTHFESGQLLKVMGDKEYTAVAMADMGGLSYVGFPTFKSWSIKNDTRSTMPLFEAVVISTNTGGLVQDARIYLEYEGTTPSLIAISNADGLVKMRIQTSMDTLVKDENGLWKNKGKVKLLRIYIGDPTLHGSNTRVYNVTDSDKQEANKP